MRALTLLASGLVLAAGIGERKPYVLGPPKGLPEPARTLVHERMARHGADMSEVVMRVTLLQYDEVDRLMRRIGAEPRLLPPDETEAGLNRLLPPRYFTLQDELAVRAEKLGEAARARDDAAMARAFGRMTETCVACHSTFLGSGTR